MLHEFLKNNRDDLTARCRVKVGQRAGRSATADQLQNGVPMFLDQLIRTLEMEESDTPKESIKISGPAGGAATLSEVKISAGQHGKDLLELGFSVDQVVHDYGDLCQAITDLAVERDAPFRVHEFRTLNRCLDNAISDAVSEFSYQRDIQSAGHHANESDKRIGFFSHELRNLLGTASLAFAAAKAGNLSLNGATGSILERSLTSLEKLIAGSLEEVRANKSDDAVLGVFPLSEFIDEICAAAGLSAKFHNAVLRAPKVEKTLALLGNRDLLMAAVANLLQNAFKFSTNNSEVLLTAYADGEHILIDVRDHCGGLGAGVEETMFLPFSQGGTDRSGLGLGLTISQQSVRANGGTLTVRDLPGSGCVFTISMPRHEMPT